MTMLEILLKTRVKYVAIGILCLFCLIFFLTSLDHSLEEEQLGRIQYKKNVVSREAEEYRKKLSPVSAQSPSDFQVQFISGKELTNEVDNEHKSFQVHRVKIMNMERSKVVVDCQDPFTSFGKVITPGGFFEFRVTDLFAKRHYWCTARYGSSEFIFQAYGEGAPRDNNQITLRKEGAFINEKRMNVEDSPMKYKMLPNRGPRGGKDSLNADLPKHQHVDHEEVPFPDHVEEAANHNEIEDPNASKN